MRLLLAISEMLDFISSPADVSLAYLQADYVINRYMFIMDVPAEFNIKPWQCLKVVKPLYGLSESGYLWYAKIDQVYRNDLKKKHLTKEAAMFADREKEPKIGLRVSYLDDLQQARTAKFREKNKSTLKKFDMIERDKLSFQFTGFTVKRVKTAKLAISQNDYLRRLEQIPDDTDFKRFRSMRKKLAKLANSRPDLLFNIATLAEVTGEKFTKDKRGIMKKLNQAIRFAISHHSQLKTPKLDPSSIKMVGFQMPDLKQRRPLDATQLRCFSHCREREIGASHLQVKQITSYNDLRN